MGNILLEAIHELRESKDLKEDYNTEEWDENILQPAIDEINKEKGVTLEYEGNGNFGEILTIWNSENEDIDKPAVIFEEGDYQMDDGEWNDDKTEMFYQTLNLINPEEKFKTKEEFKNYVLSKMVIL